ncbi:hypothetical protein MFIFM68171_10906 [Madurella fahalii]|uniref:Vacuolar ATPase assembly protein VMA22 n=1 Tax=Madurella fahalii TaxID=1157608 RepID=A0ABQ0GSI2_9PEZI
METATIDSLLQRYLLLLDEYTTLRTTLSTLQADVFQSLARANFTAERGVRYYGQDYYDERMQAVRRLQINHGSFCTGENGLSISAPVFKVEAYPAPASAPLAEGGTESVKDEGEGGGEDPEGPGKQEGADADAVGDEKGQEELRPVGEKAKNKEKPQKAPTDPLRWFGILTPLPLRQAQGQAIKSIEDIIPRLATVSAEMAGVELEVRRARKRRVKAEKTEEKRRMGLALESQKEQEQEQHKGEVQIVMDTTA